MKIFSWKVNFHNNSERFFGGGVVYYFVIENLTFPNKPMYNYTWVDGKYNISGIIFTYVPYLGGHLPGLILAIKI